jgi:chromosome segregation ATPase
MAKNEATPTSDHVTAAHQELERAKAEHEREARRLEETNQEIRSLTKQVKLTDPDDAKAFERLVAARDAARGRAEALAEREERTRGAVERAQRAVDEAELVQKRARLEALDAEIAEKDVAITRDVEAFYRQLVTRIGELRELANKAASMDVELGNPRSPYDGGYALRGSRWAAAPTHKGALKIAMGVLPETPVGEL